VYRAVPLAGFSFDQLNRATSCDPDPATTIEIDGVTRITSMLDKTKLCLPEDQAMREKPHEIVDQTAKKYRGRAILECNRVPATIAKSICLKPSDPRGTVVAEKRL
jgi:hypothetical protein